MKKYILMIVLCGTQQAFSFARREVEVETPTEAVTVPVPAVTAPVAAPKEPALDLSPEELATLEGLTSDQLQNALASGQINEEELNQVLAAQAALAQAKTVASVDSVEPTETGTGYTAAQKAILAGSLLGGAALSAGGVKGIQYLRNVAAYKNAAALENQLNKQALMGELDAFHNETPKGAWANIRNFFSGKLSPEKRAALKKEVEDAVQKTTQEAAE